MTVRLTPTDQAAVDERDTTTLEHVATAAAALERALRSMPNSIGSIFDPAVDVPIITNALEGIRLIERDALAVRADLAKVGR